MAVQELKAVEALQWAPSGNGLEGVLSEPLLFLSDAAGKGQGYGWGPGWSIVFYSHQGDIKLYPKDWLVRLSNGLVVVEKERPQGAELFDIEAKRASVEAERARLEAQNSAT